MLNSGLTQYLLERNRSNVSSKELFSFDKLYHPETYGLETLGIKNPGWVYRNIPVAQLIQHALARGEGRLASNGAFVVETGKYTGRSPQDRYIVDEPSTRDEIHWNNLNVPLYEETFDRLYRRVLAYVQGRDLYIFDDFVGADPRYRFGVRVVNEFAFQNLFVHQLFLRPTTDELAEHQADFTVIAVPGFQGDPEEDGIRSEGFVISGYTSKLAGTERGITTPQVTFSACFGQCFFSPRNRTGSTQ